MVLIEARVTDPTHLELSRPIDAPPGGNVVVSVVSPNGDGKDREEWLSLSVGGLAQAFSGSEPDYSVNSVREPNPEYRG